MESLKKLEEICQPDSRTHAFTLLDPNHPGFLRKRTIEDFHRAAESISLHEGVPERIRSHFETARNLIIYSWFYYPFNVTAQLCAYTSVEYALRLKANDRRMPFKRLLQRAVDQGWITDKGFSRPQRRRDAIQRHNEGLPPEFQVPEPPMIREYCDAIAESLPFLRNQLAHGSSLLHEQGALQVRICAELINQLFPPVTASATAASAP